jgi:Ca-activated chloride channel homolog
MKGHQYMYAAISLSVLIVSSCFIVNASAQKQVHGELKTSDSIHFAVIKVLPDSFPAVSIILKGQKNNGEPIWNLRKEDFSVLENGMLSEVSSLSLISKKQPINIAIVIDHSGSMLDDPSLLYDKHGNPLFSYDTSTNEFIMPKGYLSPMENAKITTKEFASSFDFRKDFISVIGFSSSVDKVLPLTNKKERIDSLINTMEADSMTALYDAMLAGLDQLNAKTGVNVLVALTDGQNNSSTSNWNNVIEKAALLEIPIYIIGLGKVNKDTLQMIADRTSGQFTYTATSSSFSNIYARLGKEIQSFYELKYLSSNLSSIDSKRKVVIAFDDGSKKDTISYNLFLPKEVMLYLANRSKRKTYLLGASVVLAIVVSMGTIVYTRRRRKGRVKKGA